jgi:hypothetical protein
MTIYIIEIQKSDGAFPTHRGYFLDLADAIEKTDSIIEYWQRQDYLDFENSQCFKLSGNYGRMIVNANGLFIKAQVLEFEDAMAIPDFSGVNPQDEIQSIKGTPDPVPNPPPRKRKGRV